jgi:hypothetical protein
LFESSRAPRSRVGASTQGVQPVNSKLWLVAATLRWWNRSLERATPDDAGSEYAKHRSQGPRRRPAVRKMRLQNALLMHRTGQAGLCTSRLRVHQMPEHAELCHAALVYRHEEKKEGLGDIGGLRIAMLLRMASLPSPLGTAWKAARRTSLPGSDTPGRVLAPRSRCEQHDG